MPSFIQYEKLGYETTTNRVYVYVRKSKNWCAIEFIKYIHILLYILWFFIFMDYS